MGFADKSYDEIQNKIYYAKIVLMIMGIIALILLILGISIGSWWLWLLFGITVIATIVGSVYLFKINTVSNVTKLAIDSVEEKIDETIDDAIDGVNDALLPKEYYNPYNYSNAPRI